MSDFENELAEMMSNENELAEMMLEIHKKKQEMMNDILIRQKEIITYLEKERPQDVLPETHGISREDVRLLFVDEIFNYEHGTKELDRLARVQHSIKLEFDKKKLPNPLFYNLDELYKNHTRIGELQARERERIRRTLGFCPANHPEAGKPGFGTVLNQHQKADFDYESSEKESSSDDEEPQHKKSKPAQVHALPKTLSSDDSPIASKSVPEVKTKRKRNNTTSQEQSSKENANRNVSSPQSSLVCVLGYNVKQSLAPILEVIFKKHGDITSQCLFQTSYTREHFLDLVCEVVRQIQSNDVINMQEIEKNLLDAEAAKVNVSWLHAHLETIRKRKEIMETKKNTHMVKQAAQMDLKERCAELLDAQEQFVLAKRCVKVLDLVKKKLNKNIWESIALVKRTAQKDLRERCAELVNVQERFEKTEMCVKVLHLVEENLNLKSNAQKDLLVEHDVL